MEYKWKQIVTALAMGLLLPGLAINVGSRMNASMPTVTELSAPETQPLPQTTQGAPETPFYMSVLQPDGTLEAMELDEYLTGVVLGEMPADFEPEALKAQAVVARTYTLKVYQTSTKHPGGAICTESACCQSYLSAEEYLTSGGSQAAVDKIHAAVTATHGQVLTYEGKLIDATYFSCSGGRMEDAVAVWGAEVPYLQSVDSPGEEGAAHYTDTVYFSAAQFSAALGGDLAGSPTGWLGKTTYTDGGGVDTMVIGGVTYRGTTLRQLLGLRSTAFSMTATGDGITVTTQGYGHRVGMSQYGADAMAVAGSTYDEILAHYYQGTTLQVWNN